MTSPAKSEPNCRLIPSCLDSSLIVVHCSFASEKHGSTDLVPSPFQLSNSFGDLLTRKRPSFHFERVSKLFADLDSLG